MASIREIVMRVTGDTDDAARDLATLATEIKSFGAIQAEAEANVETTQAREALDELDDELDRLSRRNVSATVRAEIDEFRRQIASARSDLALMDEANARPSVQLAHEELDRQIKVITGQLKRLDHEAANPSAGLDTTRFEAEYVYLKARLAALEKEKIDISVGLDRTFASRLYQTADGISRMSKTVKANESAIGNFFSSLGKSGVSIGFFTTTLKVAIPLMLAFASAIVAVGAGLSAMVASLAAGAAGVGALAVAFTSLLAPAIVLGIGLFRRFQEESKKAGTAAHALAKESKEFGKAFDAALGPAADAVFRGATSALQSMAPVIRGLKTEFTAFGQASGQALKTLGAEFSNPAWQSFFSLITEAATTAVPILTDAFIALSETLRNIATAAMPFLIQGFKTMRDTFKSWSAATSDGQKLSGTIEGLVSHMRTWLNLGKQVGRVILAFFKAAAPEGQRLADTLADGAERLADWMESAEGQAAIRSFLEDVIPLFEKIANLVAQLVPLFAQWTALTAPIVGAVVDALTLVVEVITDILEALDSIPGAAQAAALALAAISIKAGAGGVGGALGGLMNVLTGGILLRGVGALGGALARLASGPLRAVAFAGIEAAAALGGGALGFGLAGAAAIAGGAWLALKMPVGEAAQSFVRAQAGAVSLTEHVGAFETVLRNTLEPSLKRINTVNAQLRAGLNVTENSFRIASQGAKFLGDSVAKVGPQVARLAEAARKGAATVGPALARVGRTAAGDFAKGLRTAGGAINAAGRTLANQAVAAARQGGNAIRTVGAQIGRLFATGVQSGRGQASNAGRTIAQAVQQAAQAVSKAVGQVGAQTAAEYADGISSGVSAAAAAAQAVANAASNAFQIAGQAVYAAGAAVANMFANGIRSGIGAAVAAATDLAGAVAAVMPSSEPKDPNSPLRGLGDRGRAVVRMFAEGMRQETPLAQKTLAKVLDPSGHGAAGGGVSKVLSILKDIAALTPQVVKALGEFLNLGNLENRLNALGQKLAGLGDDFKGVQQTINRITRQLDSDDLGSKRIAKLQKLLDKDNLSDKERKRIEEQIRALSEKRRAALRDQLSSAKAEREEIKQQIRDLEGRAGELNSKLRDGLSQVVAGAFESAAESVLNIGSYMKDLGELFQRTIAEGMTGFTTSVIRTGELAGSLVSGLPTTTWLNNLFSEITGLVGQELDDLMAALNLGSVATGGGLLTDAATAAAAGAPTTNNYNVHVPPAPNTGGPGDARIVAAHLDLELRRRGRARR